MHDICPLAAGLNPAGSKAAELDTDLDERESEDGSLARGIIAPVSYTSCFLGENKQTSIPNTLIRIPELVSEVRT